MSRQIPLKRIRNIGLVAHVDQGKSSTTEAMLYFTGRIHKLGKVHEGTATMDWMDQEQERGITIMSASTTCSWEPTSGGAKYRINIIDTPGHIDFQAEVERSLRVLDGVIALFDSVAGVEPQSETVWRMMDRYDVPRICFVNKMDRQGANFVSVVQMIGERLGARAIPVQLPLGEEAAFEGVIDLVRMQAICYDENDENRFEIIEIPEEYIETAHEAHHALIDAVAEYHEPLLEAYLEDESSVTFDLIVTGIRNACLAGAVQPVLCGSALKNRAIQPLLDAVVAYLPSPLDRGEVLSVDGERKRQPSDNEPFAALAFKIQRDSQAGPLAYFRTYAGTLKTGDKVLNSTTGEVERLGRILMMHANRREDVKEVYAGDIAVAVGLKEVMTGDTLCDPRSPITLESISFAPPVVHVSVEPVSHADQEKLQAALAYIVREDPSLRIHTDEETRQTILSGMGELHLEVVGERLKREYRVHANIGRPQVAYRETVTQAAKNVEGRLIRQTGGSGQYGIVFINVEPNPGRGFEFISDVRGGAVPNEYIGAVEKGCRQAMENGVLGGYPMVDVKVVLIDGKSHPVDSSEIAFQTAGSMAMRAACRLAGPVILEPIMNVEITVPEDGLGWVMGDIGRRRGIVGERGARPGGIITVHAEVPLREMFGYVGDLRSSTQGRGDFTMEFSKYQQLPQNLADELNI